MNNPPKKYTKVNGVVRLSPEYKRWKEAFGEGGEQTNKVTKVQINLYASRLVSIVVCGWYDSAATYTGGGFDVLRLGSPLRLTHKQFFLDCISFVKIREMSPGSEKERPTLLR